MNKFIYDNKSIDLELVDLELVDLYNKLVKWLNDNHIIVSKKNILLVTLGGNKCYTLNDLINAKTILVIINCINCIH